MEPFRTEEKAVGGYTKRVVIYQKRCECGREFEGLKRQKYCSHACAARVWIREKRAKQRAEK